MLTGCVGTYPTSTTAPRFQESAHADVVIQFLNWDHFHIVRPDYREEGFLVPVSLAQFSQHLDRLKVGRNLAVVVIGINYSSDQKVQLIRNWEQQLFREGFRRVVCLQGEGGQKIDGLVILSDTGLTSAEIQAHIRTGTSL
ncbi:MAG: hypothetical protein RMN51_01135 [Verrucomicrobiota bacterium]|nr:hypothetical protein [Limisphaera sp.]MDW8380703.1 hypothetical protein [Verrucomicrobiota bacterium]